MAVWRASDEGVCECVCECVMVVALPAAVLTVSVAFSPLVRKIHFLPAVWQLLVRGQGFSQPFAGPARRDVCSRRRLNT